MKDQKNHNRQNQGRLDDRAGNRQNANWRDNQGRQDKQGERRANDSGFRENSWESSRDTSNDATVDSSMEMDEIESSNDTADRWSNTKRDRSNTLDSEQQN
jgi:hypothetical protein